MRPRWLNWRNAFAFVHDLCAASAAWVIGFVLRFNFEPIPPENLEAMFSNMPWVVAMQAIIHWRAGMYRGLWRYASLTDLRRILVVSLLGALMIWIGALLLDQPKVPRTVIAMYPVLLAVLTGAGRILYRAWREGHFRRLAAAKGKRVVILGAGTAASTLMKSMSRSAEWDFVGLLDDDPLKYEREMHGVSVLGRLEDLPSIARTYGIEQAIIAMPDQPHSVRRRALELCTRCGVAALTVPSYEDLVSGKVRISQIRRVELDDLLGRDPVALDTAGLSDWLQARVVLVTGAGGSIGAELCRQILRFRPHTVVLFDASEFALYSIEQELGESGSRVELIPVIGDIKNAARLRQVMAEYRPSIVFHAAAYKHVPLMERVNAWEAVQNNVRGTWDVARAAVDAGVEKFVMVSTDKAVNPTNVMGATKRLAEMLLRGLDHESTKFVMVRFGNVLGSTGSVIPKFRRQIAAGGPVTVTHPDITRYFMSIPEAAQLVLQAGLMGRGGEIFVLEMGEPVKIAELARDMIRLSGFSEDDIHVEYTGLRPGEKLYEELLANNEQTLPTPHAKLRIMIAASASDPDWIHDTLRWLEQNTPQSDQDVKVELARRVLEYQPEAIGAARVVPTSVV